MVTCGRCQGRGWVFDAENRSAVRCSCQGGPPGIEQPTRADVYPGLGPQFDGSSYDPARDRVRLTGQLKRVFEYMSDCRWHGLQEITDRSEPCMPQSASARLRDLRKEKFGGYVVERRNVEGGLWEYRLLPAEETQH